MGTLVKGNEVDFTGHDISREIDPISGSLSQSGSWLVEPLEGQYLSEMAWCYAGMFILSCLVRYYPNVWANAVSRRAVGNSKIDDRALALIERFLRSASNRFPMMVVNAIREPF
jgi:hypothetical protein